MRKPRTSPSHTRLEAEGWNDKEPTEVIDLALERVKRGADDAQTKLRNSREQLRRTSKELDTNMDKVLKAYLSDAPPPLDPEGPAAADG